MGAKHLKFKNKKNTGTHKPFFSSPSWGCPSFSNRIISSFDRPFSSLRGQILQWVRKIWILRERKTVVVSVMLVCCEIYKTKGWSQAGLAVFVKTGVLNFCGGSSNCSTHRGLMLPAIRKKWNKNHLDCSSHQNQDNGVCGPLSRPAVNQERLYIYILVNIKIITVSKRWALFSSLNRTHYSTGVPAN